MNINTGRKSLVKNQWQYNTSPTDLLIAVTKVIIVVVQ